MVPFSGHFGEVKECVCVGECRERERMVGTNNYIKYYTPKIKIIININYLKWCGYKFFLKILFL